MTTIIGSSSSVVVLNPGTPHVTIAGPVDAFATIGTYLSNGVLTPFEAAVFGPKTGHFTVDNTGLVISVGTTKEDVGILLAASGTIINSGTIIGGTGVNIFGTAQSDLLVNTRFIEGTIGAAAVINGDATLNNSGTLLSTRSDGAYIHFSGSARNTGDIIGYREGLQAAYGTATVSNDGEIIATAGTFINNGTTDISHGILLRAGGIVTNASAGTVSGDTGIAILGSAGGYVLNQGHVTATGHTGIYLYGAGTIDNAAGGTVQAAHTGLYLKAGGAAQNSGVILSGKSGIYLKAGGIADNAGTIIAGTSGIYEASGTANVENGKSASIIATTNGVHLKSGGKVKNAGYIEGTLGGVYLQAAGAVTNAKSGTIAAGTFGVHLTAGGKVDNAGLVDSGGTGIDITSGTAINNGKIFAHENGIYIGGTLAKAENGKKGLISAANGILLFTKGDATNAGKIETTLGNGIDLEAGGTVTNTGLISSVAPGFGGGVGIALDNGGLIKNTGTIEAATDGIIVTQGGTVIDAGKITASTLNVGDSAIYFETGASNLLILSPTAKTIGTVRGGGGVLDLEADGKKIGTAAPAQFIEFAAVTIEPKAIWDMAGTFVTSLGLTLVNDGTIEESAHDLITISGALDGAGLVELSKQAFTLDGAVAAGETIKFTGTGETLALGDPQAFAGGIGAFAAGDTIELTGIPRGSITGSHFAKGVLTLNEPGGALTLTFASGVGQDVFVLSADGAGTALTLAKPQIMSPTAPAAAAAALPHMRPADAASPLPASQAPAYATLSGWPGGVEDLLYPTPTTLPLITLQP